MFTRILIAIDHFDDAEAHFEDCTADLDNAQTSVDDANELMGR